MHVRLKRDHKTIEKNATTDEIEVLMARVLETKHDRMMIAKLGLAKVPDLSVASLPRGEEVDEGAEVDEEEEEAESENSNENLETTERRFLSLF